MTKNFSHRKLFRAIQWVFLTNAPLSIIISYLKTYLLNSSQKNILGRSEKNSKKFTTNWFDGNVGYWDFIFKNFLSQAAPLNCLEIGSWEGRSSLFILKNLPNCRLTCVDPWTGADEHQNSEFLKTIESNFDSNLLEFNKRFLKFKGTSYTFFDSLNKSVEYDLIYIDGSHYVDDVLSDALKGFKHLKVGGIMIFDDYFWNYYQNINLNPANAINSFIKLKKDFLRVHMVYSQVVISRISIENRSVS